LCGTSELTGAIPDFSALPNLQRLGLKNNQLTGTIPNLANLQYFKYSADVPHKHYPESE